MKIQVIKTTILVAIITLISSIMLIMGVLYAYFTKEEFSNLRYELDHIAPAVMEGDGMSYLNQIEDSPLRITWIGSDGVVLFDSKALPSDMENHSTREEFIGAVKNGYAKSERRSATLSERTLYSAKKLEDGTVLRISITQDSVISIIISIIQPITIVFLIAVAFAIFLSSKVAKKTIEPINNIDLSNPLRSEIYDELSPLLLRIEQQNNKINSQIMALNSKNNQFSYVIENVSDGIMLTDETGKVILVNKKASQLLSCKLGSYYLDGFRDLSYQNIIENALKGNSLVSTIKIDEHTYRFSANATNPYKDQYSVFLFICDITEEERASEMRRQFTANVSHELKTPLSTIMGSSEIIYTGIAKTEDIAHFAKNIHNEAERLLGLIQDILKLSRLDEGKLGYDITNVNLHEVCNNALEKLTFKAKQRNISLNLIGEDTLVSGYEQVLFEMVYNLCDNAISYNKQDGTVEIEIAKKDNNVALSITDSGIGIAKNEQEHIFERFYRVDKSHSKETGGTGLGLSIVKHGVKLHNAKLDIESELGRGTKVVITFLENHKA